MKTIISAGTSAGIGAENTVSLTYILLFLTLTAIYLALGNKNNYKSIVTIGSAVVVFFSWMYFISYFKEYYIFSLIVHSISVVALIVFIFCVARIISNDFVRMKKELGLSESIKNIILPGALIVSLCALLFFRSEFISILKQERELSFSLISFSFSNFSFSNFLVYVLSNLVPVVMLLIFLVFYFSIIYSKKSGSIKKKLPVEYIDFIILTGLGILVFFVFSSAETSFINKSFTIAEFLICICFFRIAIAEKNKMFFILSVFQVVLILFSVNAPIIDSSSEYASSVFSYSGAHDLLDLAMFFAIGVVGGLICMYSAEYMEQYHKKHPEIKDRRKLFFVTIFVFLFAMFGIVLASNNLSLVLLFWEVTTLASFFLIGYSQEALAKKNAMNALFINMIGGLLFSFALVCESYNIPNFRYISFVFIVIACLIKSAQLPFSSWLLGAMVAPSPVSALLHSSTMVKAGVYLLAISIPFKFHTSTAFSPIAIAVGFVGGLTFLFAALIAITQSDSKKVLAYSTISNLGLMLLCFTFDQLLVSWRYLPLVILIIFHSVTKSLLFLCVGVVESRLKSRDIEVMDGLYLVSSKVAVLMTLGIMGMYLFPFGMLLGKVTTMTLLLVDHLQTLGIYYSLYTFPLLLLIPFASAATFFYWTKWVGKFIQNFVGINPEKRSDLNLQEKVPLFALLVLILLIPTIMFENRLMFVFFAVGVVGVFAIVIPQLYKYPVPRGSVYLSGENTGSNISYRGSMGKEVIVEQKNWYMNNLFGEKKLFKFSQILVSLLFSFTLLLNLFFK